MHDFSTNQVAAAMPQAPSEQVKAAIAEIGSDLEIEIATGSEGLAHIDADGAEHGLVAKVKRNLSAEQRPISMLADAMKAGESVVFVHNVDGDNVTAVVSTLKDAGASILFHFDDYTWIRFDG